MEIHHIGYLTKNLAKSKEQFEMLGYMVEQDVQYDPIRKINICFMLNGTYRVELIEPADKESPMYPLLKNYKNTPYHFCYKATDMKGDIDALEKRGYRMISLKEPAPCIGGREVVFLLHPNMGIVELVDMHEGNSRT